MKKIEKLLKETYTTKVMAPDSLKKKVSELAASQKAVGAKHGVVKFWKNPYLKFSILALLIIFSIVGTFYITRPVPQEKEIVTEDQGPTEESPQETILVKVKQGTVTIENEEESIQVTDKTTLEEGNTLITESSSVAEITTDNGSVIVFGETSLTLADNNLNLDYGEAYIFSSGKFSVYTEGYTATVDNGSAILQASQQSTTSQLTSVYVPPIYAAVQDTVYAVSETTTVQTAEEAYLIEEGDKIVLNDESQGLPEEYRKEEIQEDVHTVITESDYAGVFSDMEAPSLKVISPDPNSVIKADSISVSLVLSEGGSIFHEGRWLSVKGGEAFTLQFDLSPGYNSLLLQFKDESLNRGTTTLGYTSEVPITINWKTDPYPTSLFNFAFKTDAVGATSAHSYGIYIDKALRVEVDINSQNQSTLTWESLSVDGFAQYSSIHSVRVVLLNSSGDIVAETEEKEFLAKASSHGICEFMVSAESDSSISWTKTGVDCPTHDGYQVMWIQTDGILRNLAYSASGADGSALILDPLATQGSPLPAGRWYVRACMYNINGVARQCMDGYKSNIIELIID